MASDYRGPFGHPSAHSMHSAGIDGYNGQELVKERRLCLEGDQQAVSSNIHRQPRPFSLPQSYDLHEATYREIEKEKIRQEVIMSEILRRRALEAEVRRELMMEKELALQGGSSGSHFGSPSRIGLDLTMRLPMEDAEGRFLEERMLLSLTQMKSLSNRHESRLSESRQVQCASDDVRSLRSLVVKPLLEEVTEKKKINLQAKAMEDITGAPKAIENVTGTKRALSGPDADESEDSKLKKRAKKEWRCDLCQISASSERVLNDHLQGKRHKAKEGQNASKTHSIVGPQLKKVAKSIMGFGTADRGMNSETKVASEPLPFSKSEDAHTGRVTDGLEIPNSDGSRKNELVVVPDKVKKNDTERRFWCEICQIGVLSQKVMDSHKMGKKHRRLADKMNHRGGVSSSH